MPEEFHTADSYWRRVEEIFHDALQVHDHARAAFVRQRCGGDAAMEQEVRSILDSYQRQDRIAARQNGSMEGVRFGPFEVVRKIGEGGMGAVYLARRQEDFEQRAAIKVIGGNPAAAALMADLFYRERQILAGLEHPNIARLLDGGVTDGGQPFLAMEYVEGLRLDRYSEVHALSTGQRLELFRKICAAVHFAHQRLVIHRDLKPGNILVDGRGEPKLLDFGIAKILNEPGVAAEQTMTLANGLPLTPEYASPEQIQGLPCTVATDVYSLGVVLFELLTGQGPFSTCASTPAEMIAAVVTREAPLPSSAAPEALRKSLRGDLDGIVAKAMAKRPEDRYGTVERLSEDIRRHLAGLPVSAVEGTRFYVAGKFVRRHRMGAGAAALIALALMGGLAATLWQSRVAERERVLAEQRFSDARKLANYLLFPLYDSVRSLPGSLPVRADMAGQALQYLNRLSSAKTNDRALRLELAEGYLRLGAILEAPVGVGDGLGDSGKALESDLKAVSLLDALRKENPNDQRIARDLARADLSLGGVLNLRGKPDDGLAKLNQAVSIYDGLAKANPGNAEDLVAAGRAYMTLVDALSGRGGGFIEMAARDRMSAAVEKAIAYFNAGLKIAPAEAQALLGLAQAYNQQGNALASKDTAQGLPVYRMGLDALQRLSAAQRSAPESEALEARLLTMVGFCQEESGLYKEAIGTLAPAQEILERMAAADPKNATNALRRVNLYRTRAFAYQYAGETRQAIADYQKAIGILDGMIAIDPAKLSTGLVRAELQGKSAQVLAKDGRMAEAEQTTRTALKFWRDVGDRPDAEPQNLKEAASAFISSPVPALLDFHRALGYAQRADRLAKGNDLGAIFYLAQCWEQLGDGPKALAAVQRGLATLGPLGPDEKPSRNRLLMEKHLHRIRILIQTGHLPKED